MSSYDQPEQQPHLHLHHNRPQNHHREPSWNPSPFSVSSRLYNQHFYPAYLSEHGLASPDQIAQSPSVNTSLLTSSIEQVSNHDTNMGVALPIDRWMQQERRDGPTDRFVVNPPLEPINNIGMVPTYRETVKSDTSSVLTGPGPVESGYANTRPSTFTTDNDDPAQTGQEVSNIEDGVRHVGFSTTSTRKTQSTAGALEHSDEGAGRAAGPSRSRPNEEECPYCGDKPRLQSELKKHMLRHERPFLCDFPNCEKGLPNKGFTTSNDLDRHKASKHNVYPPDAKVWQCAADSCASKTKTWPRLDNFRQHVERTHPHENKEELVRKSERTAPSSGVPTRVEDNEDVKSDAMSLEPVTPQPQQPQQIVETTTQPSPWRSSSIYWSTPGPMHLSQQSRSDSHQQDDGSGYAYGYHFSNPAGENDFNPTLQSTMAMPRPPYPNSFQESASFTSKSSNSGHDERCSSRSPSRGATNGAFVAPSLAPGIKRSRSTSGQKSEVIIHQDHPSRIISGIAKIFGKEDDSDAMKRVSALLEQNYVNAPIPSPKRTKRRAADKPPVTNSTTPGSFLEVISDKELSEVNRQRKLQNGHDGSSGENGFKNESVSPTEVGQPVPGEDYAYIGAMNHEESSSHMHGAGTSSLVLNISSASPEGPNTSSSKTSQLGIFKCPKQECRSRDSFPSKAALEKHMYRHLRRFGCTFDSCHKAFGSKNDWKRHENSQHFQVDIWQCDLPTKADGQRHNEQCSKLYYRKEVFAAHLKRTHAIDDKREVDQYCKTKRIGVDGQSSFWCGFCEKIISLKGKNLRAWDERFDHIGNHFTKENCDIDNWLTAGAKKTKAQVRMEMQQQLRPPIEVDDSNLDGMDSDGVGEEEHSQLDAPNAEVTWSCRTIDNAFLDPKILQDRSNGENESTEAAQSLPDRHQASAGSTHAHFSRGADIPSTIDNSHHNRYCCQCSDGPYRVGGLDQRCMGIANPASSGCGHIFCSNCQLD